MRPRILLVDGHSMIFADPGRAARHARNRAAAREELVRDLTALHDSGEWQVAVVFDGTGPKATDAGEPAGITVFYSAAGQSADAIIERLAAKYAPTCEVAAASDDRMVRTTVQSFGGAAMGCLELAAAIARARAAVGEKIRALGRRR